MGGNNSSLSVAFSQLKPNLKAHYIQPESYPNCFSSINEPCHEIMVQKSHPNSFSSINEPCHEIMVFLSSTNSIIFMSHPVGLVGCLIFGQTLRLLPYFMCVNSIGSGETARMRRLA